MLDIYDDIYDDDLLIWACQSRNSDEIMVVLADKNCSNVNDMFDDKGWEAAKYFNAGDYDAAVDYTYNVIKKSFSRHFVEEYNTRFKMYRCLADLQKIAEDSKDLDYKDYNDLVTFENVDKLYFCNLVIDDGKLGLRFSKYKDQYREEFDNLIFEEWEPDLTSSVTLMLGMQYKLNNFIEREIDYDVNFDIGV